MIEVWRIDKQGSLIKVEYERETPSFFIKSNGSRDMKKTSWDMLSTNKQECIDWCISLSQKNLEDKKRWFDQASVSHNKLIQKLINTEEQK